LRQDIKKVYLENGFFYIFKKKGLLNQEIDYLVKLELFLLIKSTVTIFMERLILRLMKLLKKIKK
tara:strand:- start:699 stop:893 length:195 start_codon:yes stop_codon:yes gene_type:complete